MGKVIEGAVLNVRNPMDAGAGTYLVEALAWIDAAKTLHEQKQSIGFGPFNHIVFHATELTLKAYLLYKGLKHEEIIDMRHDLKKILKKAEEQGLALDATYKPFISVLENISAKNMHKYPLLGSFTIGDKHYALPENMLVWSDEIYNEVRSIIRKKQA